MPPLTFISVVIQTNPVWLMPPSRAAITARWMIEYGCRVGLTFFASCLNENLLDIVVLELSQVRGRWMAYPLVPVDVTRSFF